jgi:hypothetical protein
MPDHPTPQESAAYRKVKASLDAWEMWESMSEPERLEMILTRFPAAAWYDHDPHTSDNLSTLMHFRQESRWGQIKQRFKEIGGNPWDLEKAIDAELAQRRNGTDPVPVRHFPPSQPATDLLAKTLPPLRCFVEEMLAEGLTILAGKPKKGKSYLALDMSLSLAVGRQAFMKFATEQCRVLYISLEDGERRLQRRLRQIQPNLTTPRDLHFLYDFPRLGDGALEALHYYARTFSVIIIDTLGRILPRDTPARKSLSEYQEMTDVLGAIQGFAQEQRIAIVLIDHVRKANVEDDGDAIIGSQGKFGAADHALIYGRKGEEKDGVITVISRDLEDQKIVLSMISGHLEFLGKGEIYEMDSEQNRIIKILEEETRPMTIPDIMKAMGITGETHYKRFRVVMHRLYAEDRVGRTKRGLYRLYGEDREPGMPF